MNAPEPQATLGAALADAVALYRERNPASERQFNSATQVMPGGNTRTVLFNDPFPLTMARGQDCRLWDLDGHEYLDALGTKVRFESVQVHVAAGLGYVEQADFESLD